AEVPAALERIVMRALEKRRDRRYANARDMRQDLLEAARELGGSALPEDDLAKLMQRLFAERIEQKSEMLRQVRVGRMPPSLVAAEVDEDVELPSVVGDVPTRVVPAPPPARRAWSRALLALGGAAVVAGAIASRRTEPLAAVSGLSAVAAQARPAPAPPKAPEVVVRIETTPPGASVMIGDELRGETPLD